MPDLITVDSAGQIVPSPPGETHDITIQRLENELAQEAGEVLIGALSFYKVRTVDGVVVVPEEWLGLDPEIVARRVAIAQAAWMSPKEAPVALQMAAKVFVGIVRARAEDTGPKTVNVNLVRLEIAPNQYPEMEVEREER